MNPPKRWKDPGSDASAEVRAVMKHAATRTPDAATVAALSDAVLAKLAPAAPTPSASKGAFGWTAAAKAKLLAALVSLSVAGVVLCTAKPRAPVPVPPPVAPARPAAAPAAHDSVAEQPAPSASDAIEVPQATTVSARRTKLRQSLAEKPPQEPHDELALLHAARLARRRSPEQAISILQRHERKFPESTFREEREALLIELLRAVDAEQADQRLSEFEARYPHSPYHRVLQQGRLPAKNGRSKPAM